MHLLKEPEPLNNRDSQTIELILQFGRSVDEPILPKLFDFTDEEHENLIGLKLDWQKLDRETAKLALYNKKGDLLVDLGGTELAMAMEEAATEDSTDDWEYLVSADIEGNKQDLIEKKV